jgi:hypothetical protein
MKKYRQLVEVTFLAENDEKAIGIASDTIFVLKTNEIEAKTFNVVRIEPKANKIIEGIDQFSTH